MSAVPIAKSSQHLRCPEHSTLLTAYQKAIAQFSTTLNALEMGRASIGEDEYKRLRGYVEQARRVFEHRRVDLERHLQEHGCAQEHSCAEVSVNRSARASAS